MVNKGNHPQMALIQVGELLLFTQIYVYMYIYIYFKCMYMYIYIYICIDIYVHRMGISWDK